MQPLGPQFPRLAPLAQGWLRFGNGTQGQSPTGRLLVFAVVMGELVSTWALPTPTPATETSQGSWTLGPLATVWCQWSPLGFWLNLAWNTQGPMMATGGGLPGGGGRAVLSRRLTYLPLVSGSSVTMGHNLKLVNCLFLEFSI